MPLEGTGTQEGGAPAHSSPTSASCLACASPPLWRAAGRGVAEGWESCALWKSRRKAGSLGKRVSEVQRGARFCAALLSCRACSRPPTHPSARCRPAASAAGACGWQPGCSMPPAQEPARAMHPPVLERRKHRQQQQQQQQQNKARSSGRQAKGRGAGQCVYVGREGRLPHASCRGKQQIGTGHRQLPAHDPAAILAATPFPTVGASKRSACTASPTQDQRTRCRARAPGHAQRP